MNNIVTAIIGFVLAGALLFAVKFALKAAAGITSGHQLLLFLELLAVGIILTPVLIKDWLEVWTFIAQRLKPSRVKSEPPRLDWETYRITFTAVVSSLAIYVIFMKIDPAMRLATTGP